LIRRIAGLGGYVHLIEVVFFEADLSNVDIVTIYLLPRTDAELKRKLVKELKPGARIVSHDFTIPAGNREESRS